MTIRQLAPRWPRQTASGWATLGRGLRAHPLPLALALLVTWGGVAPALIAAGLGLIAGAIGTSWALGASLIGHAVGSVFTGQTPTPFDGGAGGALAALVIVAGAVITALGAFTAVLGGALTIPAATISALVCGGLLALVGFVVAWHADLWLLARRGDRRLAWDEWVRLSPLLDAAGRALGIPRTAMPVLLIADSVMPEAAATLRAVVVTTGLLDALDDDALAGVLAHELAHWQAGDPAGSVLIGLAALPLTLVEAALLWLGTLAASSRVLGASLLASAAWLVFWPVHTAVRLVLAPAYARQSRQQEFAADARAASAGELYRAGLCAALETLAAFEAPPQGWQAVLLRTHPPAPLRLERLAPPDELHRRAAIRQMHDAQASASPTP